MGIRRGKLDSRVCYCGAPMFEVSMKNPFIDDSELECDGSMGPCANANVALRRLNASARAEARPQELAERDSGRSYSDEDEE